MFHADVMGPRVEIRKVLLAVLAGIPLLVGMVSGEMFVEVIPVQAGDPTEVAYDRRRLSITVRHLLQVLLLELLDNYVRLGLGFNFLRLARLEIRACAMSNVGLVKGNKHPVHCLCDDHVSRTRLPSLVDLPFGRGAFAFTLIYINARLAAHVV